MSKPFYCDFSTVHSLCRDFHRQHWDSVWEEIEQEIAAVKAGYKDFEQYLQWMAAPKVGEPCFDI